MLILSMKENNHQRRPAVVFLHSTHKCKEWLRPLLQVSTLISVRLALGFIYFAILGCGDCNVFCLCQAYASRGYVAIAIDSRYHGERASSKTTYGEVRILYLYFVLQHGSIILALFTEYVRSIFLFHMIK